MLEYVVEGRSASENFPNAFFPPSLWRHESQPPFRCLTRGLLCRRRLKRWLKQAPLPLRLPSSPSFERCRYRDCREENRVMSSTDERNGSALLARVSAQEPCWKTTQISKASAYWKRLILWVAWFARWYRRTDIEGTPCGEGHSTGLIVKIYSKVFICFDIIREESLFFFRLIKGGVF